MPSFGSDRGGVLYLIVCAAPPASHLASSVKRLRQDLGWEICPVVTPAALAWTDVQGLHDATGHPVRSEFRAADEPEFTPRGDAVLVAPATFNTINKCSTGMSDNLALGLINEALGTDSVALAVVPWVNASLCSHPAYAPNLALLQAAGAHIVTPDANDLASFDRACSSAGRWLAADGRMTQAAP
jgi:phosphopantothenoylcysteine synthetase/decarboxylase